MISRTGLSALPALTHYLPLYNIKRFKSEKPNRIFLFYVSFILF